MKATGIKVEAGLMKKSIVNRSGID